MTSTATGTRVSTISRVTSIDFLRGLVIILMALDHVRDYFHADAFLYDPLDPAKTDSALFFTRWITHFCAPVFVFLAGTSAFLVGQRKDPAALSSFLLKRGLWLVLLEFTVINFAWFFNIRFTMIALTVIWALGVGMIILSFLVRFSVSALLIIGLTILLGHNLLDPIRPWEGGIGDFLWAVFHGAGPYFFGGTQVFVGYPILPWTGIMILGFCFGKLYTGDVAASERKRQLISLGAIAILGFLTLRFLNIYGDPAPWSAQGEPAKTFFSFLNVSKYPPSLLYTLATLGPALVLLAFSENLRGSVANIVLTLGRVPLFFYVLHLFVIHLIALVAALATGFEASDMVFTTWVTASPSLQGYGFSLGFVYGIWAFLLVILYPVCRWYDGYKQRNRHYQLLSYL